MLFVARNVNGFRAASSVALLLLAHAARAADANPAELAYQRALSLYGSGDLQGALSNMRESHRLSGSPELLYNIARLEDETGDCPAALADYRQYLARVDQGQYRAEAEQASRELAARCSAPEAAPMLAPPPSRPAVGGAPLAAGVAPAPSLETAPPPARGRSADGSRRIIGWSAIAAGGLAGASAIYFTVSALDARSEFRESLAREAAGGPYADFGLQDDQHRDQRWAQVLAVTGGVLVGTGVVLLTLGGSEPASAEVTAGAWVSPGCVSAHLSSRF